MKRRTSIPRVALVAAMLIMVIALPLLGACTKEVVKEVPVEKIVEKEVIKQVPVERVVEKEVLKEVPVEKVVVKEVAPEAPPAKPITLRYVDHSPMKGVQWDASNMFRERVEKETNGRVKVELYYAETLVTIEEKLFAVKNGTADICNVASGKQPSELPTWTIFPTFVAFPDISKQPELYAKLRAAIPGLDEDFAKFNQKLLAIDHLPNLSIVMRDAVKTVWEIEGKTIRVAAASHKALIEGLGGHAVAMPTTDAYMAMKTGVIDGSVTYIEAAHRAKWHEVAKTVLDCKNIWLGNENLTTINIDSFNKMSKADQQVVVDAMKDTTDWLVGERGRLTNTTVKADMSKTMTFIDVPLADQLKMVSSPKVTSLADEWVKKSPDRPAIMEKAKAIVAEYLK